MTESTRTTKHLAVLFALCGSVGAATADETELSGRLTGAVTDQRNGGPVEGTLVLISGPNGLEQTSTTDIRGRYDATLRPGTYNLVFVHGTSRTSGRVVVEADRSAGLDARNDSSAGEVIVIRERLRPAVLPKPRNYIASKAPPYSDEAILTNAWTKAWLLLDVDETGRVTRFKYLKRPGYDLEKIAAAETWKLEFEPARDENNTPRRTWIVWQIEWPSAWWLQQITGTRSAMPKIVGYPPRRQDQNVPCAGSGPWRMGSLAGSVYRDCSKPDLSKAQYEAWIVR